MKLIPGTDGYYADETGRIFDKDLNELGYVVTPDGYVSTIIPIPGMPAMTNVHRLVLMTYDRLPNGNEHGNHIDGNRANNHITNLEWATPYENTVHGVLLFGYTKRPLIVATKGEEEFYLNNLHHAAEHFNVDLKTIWNHIKKGELIDGWLVEHLRSEDKRVKAWKHFRPDTPDTYRKCIYVKSLITGEIKYYPTRKAFAVEKGVNVNNVCQQICTPNYPKVFQKEFVIVQNEPNFDFLTESLKEELLSRGGKEVVILNVKTKTFFYAKSAYSFIKSFQLNKNSVTNALKAKQLKIVGDFLFSYRSDFNEKVREQMMELADYFV